MLGRCPICQVWHSSQTDAASPPQLSNVLCTEMLHVAAQLSMCKDRLRLSFQPAAATVEVQVDLSSPELLLPVVGAACHTPSLCSYTAPPLLQTEAMPFGDNMRDLPERYGYKRFLTGWHEIRQALYEPVADLVQFEHKVRHRHVCSSATAHPSRLALQCHSSAMCCTCHPRTASVYSCLTLVSQAPLTRLRA